MHLLKIQLFEIKMIIDVSTSIKILKNDIYIKIMK